MTSSLSSVLLLVIMALLTKAVKSLQENCILNTSSTANLLWEGELQNHFIYFGSLGVPLQSSLFKQISL